MSKGPYALRRALKGMSEYQFLAIATISVVATVLLLLGAFAIVLTNLSGVLDRWGKDVQISCYLQEDINDSGIFRLKAELETMSEVAAVTYVSKDEALQQFGNSIDGLDRILADLDTNPLPASLEVRLLPAFQRPEQVAMVAASLERPEFQALDYSHEWVERYHSFLSLLRLSAFVLGTLLLAAAIFLVGNTIRLAIYARRDELAIVALVGGTRWFARLPFLVEGALQGLLGGLVALLLLRLLHQYAFLEVQDSLGMALGPELMVFLPTSALLGLLVAGLGVGLLGAWTSVARSTEEAL